MCHLSENLLILTQWFPGCFCTLLTLLIYCTRVKKINNILLQVWLLWLCSMGLSLILPNVALNKGSSDPNSTIYSEQVVMSSEQQCAVWGGRWGKSRGVTPLPSIWGSDIITSCKVIMSQPRLLSKAGLCAPPPFLRKPSLTWSLPWSQR